MPQQGRFAVADIDPITSGSSQGQFSLAAIDPEPPRLQSPAGADRQMGTAPGNIDLFAQPQVKNQDGTTSTVDSSSYHIDGQEVLLPSVTPDGRHLKTPDEIVAEYRKTGRHLGKFSTPEEATAYASQLHNEYAAGKYDRMAAQLDPTRLGQVPPMSAQLDPTKLGQLPEPPTPSRRPMDIVENAARSVGAGAIGFNVGFWGALQAAGDVLGFQSVSDFAKTAGQQATELATTTRGPQTGAGANEQALYSGFESMGLSIPALAAGLASGNPNVTLGIMGAATGGQAYPEAREKTGTIQALAHAVSQAAIEIATEEIPATRLLSDLANKTGMLKMITRQLAAEIPGEQVATLLQDLNSWATLHPEAPFGQYVAERPGAAAQTLIATLVATVGQSAATAAVERVTRSTPAAAPGPQPSQDTPQRTPAAGVPPPSGAQAVAVPATSPGPAAAAGAVPAASPATAPPAVTSTAPVPPEPIQAHGRFRVDEIDPPSTLPGPQTAITETATAIADETAPIEVRNGQHKSEQAADIPVQRDLAAIQAGRALERRMRDGQSPTGEERRAPVVEVTPKNGGEEHKLSSTQINLPPDRTKRLMSFTAAIPDRDLAEKGREATPHVTVKFGIHTTDVDEIRALLADEPPITLQLGQTSFFPNSESNNGDVLKVDVDSAGLHRLNAKIAGALKVTDTHPEYVPHVTLAYLKPGLGKKYAGGDYFKGQNFTVDTLTFTGSDGRVYEIKLTGQRSGKSSEKSAAEMTYEDFAGKYRDAFARSNNYKPDQVGSKHYTDQMATLADAHPEYLDRLEAEEDGHAAAPKADKTTATGRKLSRVERILGEAPPLQKSPPSELFLPGKQFKTASDASEAARQADREIVRVRNVTVSGGPPRWVVYVTPAQAQPLTVHERRRLRQIHAEMADLPFSKKNFNEVPRGKGGTLDVSGGAAGAKVFDDILVEFEGYARPTRKQVATAIQQTIDGVMHKPGTMADRIANAAVIVAKTRAAGKSLTPNSNRLSTAGELDVSAGDEPAQIYVKGFDSLPSEQAAVQARVIAALEADSQGFVRRYREKFGNVVSADLAKELFPEYASKADRTANDLAVHQSASALAQHVYEQLLQEPTADGHAPYVVFTSGGTGSGKTTSLDKLFPGLKDAAHIVYDSTLSHLTAARRNVQLARDNGLEVTIVFTDTDAAEAFKGTLARATDTGRPVTLVSHLSTHLNAPKVFQALQEATRGDKRVTFWVARVEGGDRTLLNVDEWQPRVYNEPNVRRQLTEVLDAERAAGRISPELDAAVRPRTDGGIAPAAAPDEVRREDRDRPASGEDSARGLQAEDVDPTTGEVQPRLPGAESVRDTETQTPQLDAPFSLSAEADTTKKGVEQSLFDAPKKPGNPSGGGNEGMAGLFAQNIPATAGRIDQIRPLQFPELVDLARELARTPSVVKAFRMDGKRGEFQGATGTIRLAADLFKSGEEQQLAATLAHEIGHLVDWLPDRHLKRGNLLGRIYTLRSFLKHTFIGQDGSQIKLKDVRNELTALSDKWRPWDKDKASASFKAYRNSSKELFADAISVLLNNPGLLEKDAPIFYEQFFAELDNKPEVKEAYFGLQELLSGTPEELIARRRAGVREMFNVGDTKAIDLERLRQAEQVASRKNLWLKTKIQLIDKHTPIIDRVKQLEKQGVRINPDDDPRYFLEERNYLGGKLKAFTEQHFQPIYQALTDVNVHWHTFGEALFYERIIAGDRSEMANPRGISPAVATDLLNDLMLRLTAAQRTVARAQMTAFRAVVKGVAEAAHTAGLYTDDLHTQMQENPAYVSFRVIEHLENDVTSRVHKQVGTLKDITNPADASMLKTLVTIRAMEHQKVKVATFDFLTQHFPQDIAQAKEAWTGKGHKPIDPKEKGQRLITYYEKGKLRGKYVDDYIADSLENVSIGGNLSIVSALRWVNSGLFRPVFTSLNLGFQTFNLGRDFLRFWKNVPGMSVRKAVARYIEAVPLARARAFGTPINASFTQRLAHKDLLAAESAQILSTTFNDLINGREVADTQIEDTLAKMGVGGYGEAALTGWRKPLGAVMDWIKKSGDFIETLPKAAGIYEYKGAGTIAEIPADKRSHIRRKVGSPDYLAGGTAKPLANEIFLFSNAITQAIRSDLEVATAPSTRSGFWWKTAGLNVMPKLLAFAVLYGLKPDKDDEDSWGQTLRRIYQGISEYDLTNYNNIPVGFDTDGSPIYVRLPQDDFGRLIGGLAWKALQAARGDRDALKSAMQVLDYTAGQLPGVTPTIGIGSDIAQFAAGRNVYDAFRSRFLFTDDEAKAGGWMALKKFVGYEFQQLGGGIVWKFYPGGLRPRSETTGQKILDLPFISNVAGRWIKISDYGQIERLRDAKADVEQVEAKRRLETRAAVNEAIRSYTALPAGQRNPAALQSLARQVVADLKPPPKDRAELFQDVMKKIRMGTVHGESDPLTDVVMSSTSNAQKVAVILDAADQMSAKSLQAWLLRAAQQNVISPAIRAEVLRELRPASAAGAAK